MGGQMDKKFNPEILERINKFPESYRWQLVEAFRKRSDEAANYLRALLLAISTAALGYLFDKNYAHPLNWHHLSILALAGAIAFIIWSWDRQKTKSILRLIELREKGYEEYLELEKCFAKFRKNEKLDRASYVCIGIALFIEAAIAVFGGKT
jgi:hypothetical protein